MAHMEHPPTDFPGEEMLAAMEVDRMARGTGQPVSDVEGAAASRNADLSSAVREAQQKGHLLGLEPKPPAPHPESVYRVVGQATIKAPTASQAAQQIRDVGVNAGGNPHHN